MTVDFVKTRFESSFALRCSENCCALQGQHSEVTICNVNRLGRLGLALLSLGELGPWGITAFEFSDPRGAAVRIPAPAGASSHSPSCQMTAQAPEKHKVPVEFYLLRAGSYAKHSETLRQLIAFFKKRWGREAGHSHWELSLSLTEKGSPTAKFPHPAAAMQLQQICLGALRLQEATPAAEPWQR